MRNLHRFKAAVRADHDYTVLPLCSDERFYRNRKLRCAGWQLNGRFSVHARLERAFRMGEWRSKTKGSTIRIYLGVHVLNLRLPLRQRSSREVYCYWCGR